MGTDRLGNLWSWSSQTGAVLIANPADSQVTEGPILRGVRQLDMDREWGVVALGSDGATLRWQRWRPALEGEWRSLVLQHPAGDVCWVDRDHVAVSPQLAGHRVEVIELSSAEVVLSFGQEQEVSPPETGVVRARHVHLVMDHPRQRLATLDSFTGSFEAYDLDGTLLFEAELQPPDHGAVVAWLEELDRSARAAGETRVQTMLSLPSLAVDRSGSSWTVTDANPDNLTLFEITPEGQLRRHSVDSRGCPGRLLLVHSGWSLVFRPEDHPRGFCTTEWRMP